MESLSRNEYFQSLPVWMRENICQSGAQFQNEQELRSFSAQFLNRSR